MREWRVAGGTVGGEVRECGNKHAPRTSTLVRSPNARLKPAELERGAVFRDGAAIVSCGERSEVRGRRSEKKDNFRKENLHLSAASSTI